MRRLGAIPPRVRVRGPLGRRLGPPGAAGAMLAAAAGAVVLAVIAIVTLGLAALFLRGGRARMWTFPGRRRPGEAPGAHPGGRVGAGVDPLDPANAARTRSGPASGTPRDPMRAAPRPGAPRAPRGADSGAEVLEAWPVAILLALSLGLGAAAPARARLLVPMDEVQTDHLRAYGLTFWVLTRGQTAEWLLNYRGGAFLLEEDAQSEREANLRGVVFERVSGATEAQIRATMADENMDAVKLEKAPRVAVYIPPNTPPWDDAVTLALEYAQIPYDKVWDEEVLRGKLVEFDWLHLHHEDFTGQHGKFYAAYHTFPWYKEEEAVQQAMAQRLGFAKVPQLKGAVAGAIKEYVGRGGFMFGMCSATDTYDIALAATGVDIADVVYDGDPPEPAAQARLDMSRTLAFKDFRLEMDPFAYRFSDIDVTQEASLRGPNAWFSLFDFSAKNDPVPTMLVQNHVAAVAEFLGQSTGFRRAKLKSGVLVLGEVEGTDEVKYLHGQFGRGTFTFLGGHDPEDYQHMVGDPPTDLSQYKHSPGYRLILNNVLFPAAEKKKQRT